AQRCLVPGRLVQGRELAAERPRKGDAHACSVRASRIPRPSGEPDATFVLGESFIRASPHSGGAFVNDFFVRLYMLCRRDSGQTMAEYAIVLGIISVTLVLALTALSGSVAGALGRVAGDL